MATFPKRVAHRLDRDMQMLDIAKVFPNNEAWCTTTIILMLTSTLTQLQNSNDMWPPLHFYLDHSAPVHGNPGRAKKFIVLLGEKLLKSLAGLRRQWLSNRRVVPGKGRVSHFDEILIV